MVNLNDSIKMQGGGGCYRSSTVNTVLKGLLMTIWYSSKNIKDWVLQYEFKMFPWKF